MARALKYLEDFGQLQSQLFKVLEKYHLLPDNFKNLQSQFGFSKKAALKNIEHLQQAINMQQNCAATICTYINNILLCITKLEQTVLELQKWITTDHDRVQSNTPDYDPDIDGPQPPRRHVNTEVVSVQDHFTLSESEILDVAESQAEDHTTEESAYPIHHNSEESHGYEDFPSDIQINTTAPYRTTTEYNVDSKEIPELEDWDNGEFADAESTLITNHNTHSESERIRWDYTQQLLDLMDNIMKRRLLSISCSTPVLMLTITDHHLGGHKEHPMILTVTTFHCPTQQTYSTGMHKVEGKELYYMDTDFLVRKPDLLLVEKPE